MKRIIIDLAFIAIVIGALSLAFRGQLTRWIRGARAEPPGKTTELRASTPTGQAGERKILYYQDSMNAAHRSDKPGTDSMGMPLVPVYADEMAIKSGTPSGTVLISPRKQQLIGVRTTQVERQEIQRTITTVAQIQPDETKIAHIHVKVSGWLDQVYVDFVGQLVKKGQPLLTLYSPDLVATEQEYLIARRGQKDLSSSPFPDVSRGADSLLRAARERLSLWDISDEQIKKLDETGEVSRTMTLYSPITGFVLDRKAYPQVAVTPDMDLYTLADLSTVWALADVYEYEAPYVQTGQGAEMSLAYLAGRRFWGRVNYIYPQVDPQTRTLKVRIEFSNPGFQLKPGMFAQVQLKVDYGLHVVVPQEAVLDSGSEQTVFVVRGDGYFEPRRIETGPRVDNQVIVLSGLKPGETIVASGNFLVDSESQLKSAVSDMKH